MSRLQNEAFAGHRVVGAVEDAEARSRRRKVMVNDRDGFRTPAPATVVKASDEFSRFVLDADSHTHPARRPERPGQCSEGQRPSLWSLVFLSCVSGSLECGGLTPLSFE